MEHSAYSLEFFVKMHHLNQPTKPTPLPMPVFHNPCMPNELQEGLQNDDDSGDSGSLDTGTKLMKFLKDPLHDPESIFSGDDEVDPEKLGRNMRARKRHGGGREKNVLDLMDARKQLLLKQKGQLEKVNIHRATESSTKRVLNALLSDGYHIKPSLSGKDKHPMNPEADAFPYTITEDSEEDKALITLNSKQTQIAVNSALKQIGIQQND